MIGIDEVGRGALAGPLLVCAVRLKVDIAGLKDSKQLSANKRRLLSKQIIENADIGYGWVDSNDIDNFGLAQALRVAAKRAIEPLDAGIAEVVIIDGTIDLLDDRRVQTMIKADQSIPEVMAASIAAKVARDNYMNNLSLKYPQYGFSSHVGYGTLRHRLAIKQHGTCPEHRKTFKLKVL